MMRKVKNLLRILMLFSGVLASCQSNVGVNLEFKPEHYKVQELTINSKKIKVRAYENIVYVAHPVDTAYQKINIYIPEEYFSGKSVNGYTATTAPVFFPNEVGGYMPAGPATALTSKKAKFPGPMGEMPEGFKPPEGQKRPGGMNAGGPPPGMMVPRESTVIAALANGYVVASAGARGRTLKDADETFTGKAPAAIVDLKAAIRYLKYNDSRMPGDAGKIISNGTSAGGALSSLLGATGNNADYEPYLKALGAANGTDNIFAVSAYCPITNLDNADMTYEWQFNGINTVSPRKFPGAPDNGSNNKLSENQVAASATLKRSFADYVNKLGLKGRAGEKLTLNEKGEGSFKDYLKRYVIASAQQEADKGTDLSQYTWLTIKDKKVIAIDFDAHIKYMTRMKTPPAFDTFDLSSGENQLFGTAKTDKQHFTSFGSKNSTVQAGLADPAIVKLMNPMYYIGKAGTDTSKYWRVRHGTKDSDTSLAISMILATTLENNGYTVDYALPWDKPHSGDYDLTDLFNWIDSIAR